MVAMKQQDYARAIALLDQATQIDSNFLTAYANKLSFQLQLKQFDNALQTAYSLNRINPNAPDYYVTIGLLYHIKGDTGSSKEYFTGAAVRYDKILDTMSMANKSYDMLLMNKAVNLVLIGQQKHGNDILKELYERQKDEAYREMLALFLNKTKDEIIKSLMQGD